MSPACLAAIYHRLLPILRCLPLRWQVKLAAQGRNYYMQQLVAQAPSGAPYLPSESLAVRLWGIDFRTPLANSAGMFKNGEAYDLMAHLGAGAYLGGTSTANPRRGNKSQGIHLPFISLPKSQAAINFLGLPSLGDELLSSRIISEHKLAGCPIGWSVMRSPDLNEAEGLRALINSLWLYHDNHLIDFIEVNESCPNIKSSSATILPRLAELARQFLSRRRRHLPVIVKLSNDLGAAALREVIQCLVQNGFDGINLGNTSTAYGEIIAQIDPAERELFSYFSREFGGGVSGKILKAKSLQLCGLAAEELQSLKPNHEFHIIRSGGIDCWADLAESRAHGVSYNQWYTGFFNTYAISGSKVYRDFFQNSTG